MQTRKNDNAFPFFVPTDDEDVENGLTKREYFALIILQGIISSGNFLITESPQKAVEVANELVKALNTPDE